MPDPHSTAPHFETRRVKTSNYRRVMWGHALTVTGVVGILTGAVGMILMSYSAERRRGPGAQRDPALARRYRRQQDAGLVLLCSGLGVGLGGLISGPLLVRSGRRRQHAQWSKGAR